MIDVIYDHYAAAAHCIAERELRADRMWERFERLVVQDGGRRPGRPQTPQGIIRRLAMYLRRGEPDGWYWGSAIEYTEVVDQKGQPVPFGLDLREPEPTPARAGSHEKLLVLADRVAIGEELFHKGDGPGVMVGSEGT